MNGNFKEWFQKSAVKNGKKPLIVYHGTQQDFTVFNTEPVNRSFSGLGETAIGAHFTEDKEIASSYPFGKGAKNTMEVYLSIQNPKKFRTVQQLRDELFTFCKDRELSITSDRLENVAKYKRLLIKQGYDGITYLEGSPHHIKQNKKRVWVAFYPWQIKSIQNSGTFSKEEHDIYH